MATRAHILGLEGLPFSFLFFLFLLVPMKGIFFLFTVWIYSVKTSLATYTYIVCIYRDWKNDVDGFHRIFLPYIVGHVI
jgi:hypothetical protein